MHPFMQVLTIFFLASVWIIAHSEDALIDDGQESATADSALVELTAFEDAGVLSDDELNDQRARERTEVHQVTINDQDQDGDVSENVAIDNTNGDNLIDGDAFSNSHGFLSTVQNTGNNVLIQNSTIINVSVDAAPAPE